MRMMILATSGLGALALAACGDNAATDGQAQAQETASSTTSDEGDVDLSVAVAGVYEPDPKHAHILFNYGHQGLSQSWVRWDEWTGELDWNPDDPAASTVSVTIDATSVDSDWDEFNDHLQDDRFFDTANNPEITFESTSVEQTGPATGKINGDLTIRGVTKPVTLDVKYNNAVHDAQRNVYKIGFSATTSVKRSEFGMDTYVPFVDDEVNIILETEWNMQGEAQ